MKAAVCRALGPPENVVVEENPAPEPGPGQVRVSVHAAAVNHPDVLLVAGDYQIDAPVPFTPGSEFAGVVSDVAPDVETLRPGDRVFGTVFVGAFAEEVVVDAGALTPVPAGVTDTVAAAFGVAHRTAYHVLRSVARLEAGEQLVVLGAGGGVGLAAVQLGVVLGAEVTAVASTTDKLMAAAEHGAGQLIDHRSEDLREALRSLHPEGTNVVVDPVGGDLAEPALRSLRWGGRFVTIGYASGVIPRIPLNLVLLKGVHVLGFQFLSFAQHEPDEMARNDDELLELLAAGRATPHVGATHRLDDVVVALRQVADGQAIGKVLVTVDR